MGRLGPVRRVPLADVVYGSMGQPYSLTATGSDPKTLRSPGLPVGDDLVLGKDFGQRPA
jgi:hypothetical protein